MPRGKLRLAFDEMLREKNSAVNVILECIALILIGIIIFIQSLNGYNRSEADKILKYGVERSGKIVINEVEENAMLEEFYKEFRNVEGIKAVGSVTDGNFGIEDYKDNVFQKIYDQQTGNKDVLFDFDEEWGGKVVETILMVQGSENIVNMKVSKGYSFDECKKLLQEYEQVIYLGNKLSGYEIGEVVCDEEGKRSIIGGYLEEGQRILKEEITNEPIPYIETDYKMLMLQRNEEKYWGDPIFSIDKKADMNEVKEKIVQLGKEYGIDVNVKTYSGIFEGIEKRNKTLTDFLGRIAFIIVITVVILQICMQTVHLIENFKNYGILYANGFSAGNHFFVFSVQSIIKGIIAFAMAIGVGYFIIDIFYTDMVYSLDVMYDVFWNYVSWKVGICALIIAILTSVITIFMFTRKTPKELIQEG